MQLWPLEEPLQTGGKKSFVAPGRRGGGCLLAGGCLALAAPLCPEGGRDCICQKLQEADEVLIC